MFCKKLCCDITIRLVTINFQSCVPYSVTSCISSPMNIFLTSTPMIFWKCEASFRSQIIVIEIVNIWNSIKNDVHKPRDGVNGTYKTLRVQILLYVPVLGKATHMLIYGRPTNEMRYLLTTTLNAFHGVVNTSV
jgi:hypothetical protein